jgi:hypothetical protein
MVIPRRLRSGRLLSGEEGTPRRRGLRVRIPPLITYVDGGIGIAPDCKSGASGHWGFESLSTYGWKRGDEGETSRGAPTLEEPT